MVTHDASNNEAIKSTGQDGHVVETPAPLQSISEERAEIYPRSTINDTEDEHAHAPTDTHPPGLETPTKTETLTNPINDSEARSEITSILEEQCGALRWRACYFDVQVNGTTKALNTTPFHANRGSHAYDTSIGQEDGMDDNIPALSTDIMDRLTGILGKWSSFQFGDLGCEPTADNHRPLDEVYAPIGYSRIPDKLADGNCYFNEVARQIYGDVRYANCVRQEIGDWVETNLSRTGLLNLRAKIAEMDPEGSANELIQKGVWPYDDSYNTLISQHVVRLRKTHTITMRPRLVCNRMLLRPSGPRMVH